jgi:hypothetical protein
MKYVVLVMILVLCAASAFGFDGARKGFVIGGGIGLGYATVSVNDVPGAETLTNFGGALDFLIGYAWDEQNMIVFLRDGVIYSEETVFGGSLTLAQGFSGVGYYHYFGLPGKSFFLTGGLGLQDWTPLESGYEANDYGFGILGGGGYEFTPHVQVYGSLSFGQTSDIFADYTHFQFQIGVSAVAF